MSFVEEYNGNFSQLLNVSYVKNASFSDVCVPRIAKVAVEADHHHHMAL
jgi:hypothetical protein